MKTVIKHLEYATDLQIGFDRILGEGKVNSLKDNIEEGRQQKLGGGGISPLCCASCSDVVVVVFNHVTSSTSHSHGHRHHRHQQC